MARSFGKDGDSVVADSVTSSHVSTGAADADAGKPLRFDAQWVNLVGNECRDAPTGGNNAPLTPLDQEFERTFASFQEGQKSPAFKVPFTPATTLAPTSPHDGSDDDGFAQEASERNVVELTPAKSSVLGLLSGANPNQNTILKRACIPAVVESMLLGKLRRIDMKIAEVQKESLECREILRQFTE